MKKFLSILLMVVLCITTDSMNIKINAETPTEVISTHDLERLFFDFDSVQFTGVVTSENLYSIIRHSASKSSLQSQKFEYDNFGDYNWYKADDVKSVILNTFELDDIDLTTYEYYDAEKEWVRTSIGWGGAFEVSIEKQEYKNNEWHIEAKNNFDGKILFLVLNDALKVKLCYVTDEDNTEFAGGSGTELDPYLIATKEHLNNVRNHLDAHFKMISDIEFMASDFSEGGAYYNEGQGWKPIGINEECPFAGVFDGNGHKVMNSKTIISSTQSAYAGLFGCSGGTIKNLGIAGSTVEANSTSLSSYYGAYAGGIVGYVLSSGLVSNCYNSGCVKATTEYNETSDSCAGGIVGISIGRIIGCHNGGDITGKNSGGIAGTLSSTVGEIADCYNWGTINAIPNSSYGSSVYGGGIAGSSKANIKRCYNLGKIIATATGAFHYAYAGGVAGFSNSNSVIECCYNIGHVAGTSSNNSSDLGGIVGVNRGIITNCYNCGSIETNNKETFNIGGIAGEMHSGKAEYCYNVGSVIPYRPNSMSTSGGIVGFGSSSSGYILNCYYINLNEKGVWSGYDGTQKCTEGELKEQTTYSGFDFDAIWTMDGTVDYPYPELKNTPMHSHSYDNSCDTDCNVCGVIREITHQYDNDCDGSCNICEDTRSPSDHVYSNDCDIDCNSCNAVRIVGEHIYDDACDTTCNNCGANRLINHTYTNACDGDCNICGATRNIAHIYSNACDDDCNICGATRIVSDHIYDNICDEACNICGVVRLVEGHKYTDSCDATCDKCGAIRTVAGHSYTNSCDTTCDKCGATRTITHTYSNSCDTSCNICGATRSITHTYGAYVYNDDATCNRNGTKTRVCLVCSQPETVTAEGTKLKNSSAMFKDVQAGEWYKPYIDYAVTYRLLNGTGNGMEPTRTMTRAEFVQVLANLSGIDTANKQVNAGFNDVKAGDWYAPAVKWASANGIVNGMDSNRFAPNDHITREQMCTMLIRYIEGYLDTTLEKKANKKTFADDTKISGWAKESVYKCQMGGLVNGVSETEFAPADKANRSAVATIMTRFHQQYINN